MNQLAENILQFPGQVPADPKQKEVRVADVNDGYTRIANDLLEAVMLSGLTQHQLLVAMAVIRKTCGYNKEMDWVSNDQMAELTGLSATRCSTIKNQLIKMDVLKNKGREVGMNNVISEWKTAINGACKTFTHSGKKRFPKSRKVVLQNLETTKDIEIKDNTPHTPQGGNGHDELENQQRLADAKTLLTHYNQQANARCISPEPFLKALSPTSSRRGYTVEEITLVIDWALTTWNTRNGKPKPENLCRMSKFDGYLSDATVWHEQSGLYPQMLDAYNARFADRLPEAEGLHAGRIKAMQALLAALRPANTLKAFEVYLDAFDELAGPHYYGDNQIGWKADLDHLLKLETLNKTRENKLLAGGAQ